MIPLGVDISALTDAAFWIGVGVFAGTYVIVALGLQLNVGYTGMSNFGAAGFMAIGAYTMGALTLDTGLSFWLSLPLSMLAAMAFGDRRWAALAAACERTTSRSRRSRAPRWCGSPRVTRRT